MTDGLVRRLAFGLALSVAACAGSEASTTPARLEAQRLFMEGLDHAVRLQHADAVNVMRRALVIDPSYLPALNFVMVEGQYTVRLGALIDTLASQATDPGIARCLQHAAAVHRGVEPVLGPAPRETSSAARWCEFHLRVMVKGPQDDPGRDSLERLGRLFPEWPILASAILTSRLQKADRAMLNSAMRHATNRRVHALQRAYLMSTLAMGSHNVGDDSLALNIERAVTRDPAWRLPGFRTAWAAQVSSHGALPVLNKHPGSSLLLRHADSAIASANEVWRDASRSGDQRARLESQVNMAIAVLDRGRLEQAVRELAAAVPLVDSIGDPGLRAYVLTRLGRALVKAGRAPEAEQILLTARALGEVAASPRVQKETEHNLLHLYESLGRDADALHAGEQFVRYASAGPIDPVRMMSARDVALFLRARGRVDESRPYFAKMLADIDTLGNSTNYAGEYYEMTGMLDRAFTEYAKAAADEPLRALSGMVRVALATGDTATARQWAAVHDARRDAVGRPEATPLLPSVLRRTIGGETARQAFLKARHDVLRHGQIASWAALTADLAELENDAARFDRGAFLADSAREAASRVGAAETALRARALAAFARARRGAGDREGGLRALAVAARDADRSGGVLLRAEVHRLLADARSALGQWREALVDYRHAVIPLDSVAGRIAMDPSQAAFRSAQRRAYDDALLTIVRNGSVQGAADAFAAWSSRRKGRAYVVQWPVDQDRGLPRPDRGHAIVDYVLLDTVLAALVVTERGANIVRFDITTQQLRADVKALRRSVDVRVGSTLDVGRARFPLEVAHRLYQVLIAPLESYLAGVRTIMIVPDGILSLVPFDALVIRMPEDPSAYESAEYLLDRRVVTNATLLWTSPDAWHVATQRVTVINPGTAPNADHEVKAVTNVLSSAAFSVLQGQRATRRLTVAAMRQADIVHFAAHARANEHDPGSSQLELSPDDGDDGRLGATEVSTLVLDAPLVVLSACETANGVVFDGEGVLSLSRSFLRAGARATVATLWPVGPAAAEFAEAFYAGLAASHDAATAVRTAKLAMRSRGLPPSTWAPYQLFAAPSLATRPSRTVAYSK